MPATDYSGGEGPASGSRDILGARQMNDETSENDLPGKSEKPSVGKQILRGIMWVVILLGLIVIVDIIVIKTLGKQAQSTLSNVAKRVGGTS